MKQIGLKINIGAKIGSALEGIKKLGTSTSSLGLKIEKLGNKRIDIIANNKDVLKVKNNIKEVEKKLDSLKKRKTELSLKLDKTKVSKLNNSIRKIDDKIDKLRDKESLIKLEIKTTTDEKELKKLNRHLATTRKNIKKLSSEKIDLKGELIDVKDANEKVNIEIKKTQNEINKLNSKSIDIKDDLVKARTEAEKTNTTIAKIGTTIRKINSTKLKIQQTVDRRENFKQNVVSNVARVGAVAMPIKSGIEFESSMARVKAITMATDTQFKTLEKTALKLGSSTTFSSSEVAQGMQYLSMAGFKTTQTVKAMPGVLNLASAGAVDLATTSDIASNVLSGFKIKAEKMGMVSDVMAKAITSANVDVMSIGETMKYAATPAQSLGDSIQTVTALTGKLGDIGIKGSEAGTALRSMYLRMAAPPKEAEKVVNKLNLKLKDSKGNFLGMLSVLQQLKKKTKGMGNTVKSDYMKKLFGTEAVSAAIALTDKADGTLKKYIKTLENSGGFAQKMADIQNATTAGALKAFGSAVEGIAIKFSKMFTPAITYTAKKLSSVSGWIGKMMDRFPKFTSAVSIGGVAILAGGVALASFAVMAGFALNGIRMLRLGLLLTNASMLATRGTTLLTSISFKNLGKTAIMAGKMMMRTPILLAIGAIGAGASLIYKYWEPIKGFFRGVGIGISYSLKPIGDAISSIFLNLKSIITPFVGLTRILGAVFKSMFGSVYEAISGILSPVDAVSDSVNEATNMGKKFGAWIGTVGAGVAGFYALKLAVFGLNKAFKVGAFIAKTYGFAIKTIPLVWAKTKEYAHRGAIMAKTVAMGTATLAVKAYGLASNLAVGGLKILGRTIAFVGRAMLLNPIGIAVTAIAGTAYLLYEYWEPISSFFSSLWSGVQDIFSSVLNSIKNTISFAWEGIKTIFNWSPFGIITSNWQPILGFFGGIGTGIKNLFSMGWNGLKMALSWNPLDFVAQKWNNLANFFSNFSLKDAGAKIITSVVDGFNSKIEYLKGKVSSITQTIRDYWPFSPAKRGALKDIHRIKLMETIASGLNEKPLLKAVNSTTTKVRKSLVFTGAGIAFGGSLAIAQPVSQLVPPQKQIRGQVVDRNFETKENLLTKSLPTLNNRTFDTIENLKLSKINPISDRTFKTTENLSQANIPKVFNRNFETKENLLTKSLPTLNNRTFDTIENLKLSKINPISDRTFKTTENLSQANIPKVFNRDVETKESLLTKSLPSQNNTNNQTINIIFGDTHLHNNIDKEEFLKDVEYRVKKAIRDSDREKNNIRMYD